MGFGITVRALGYAGSGPAGKRDTYDWATSKVT